MSEPFELECEALGDDALLVAFRGREGLSELFRLEVFVSLPLAAIPERDALVGESLTLSVRGETESAGLQPTSGIVVAFEVLEEVSERALVRLDVRPRVWLATLSRHSRVFTESTVPDIFEEVLSGYSGVDYELCLEGTYEPEPHVSQYQESDFDFVQRLAQHEGIYFYFEHAGGRDKLVLTDHRSHHAVSRATPVPFVPVLGGEHVGESFEVFRERRKLVPKLVRLTDYQDENPALEVKGEEVLRNIVRSEAIVHDARAASPAVARRLALLRKEELLAAERVFEARGKASHLRSGATFTISGHPRQALSSETFLCVALDFAGNARARTPELAGRVGVDPLLEYEVAVRAIAASVQYRAPRSAPRPRVANLERGTVDGPADSDYAQLDDRGRYRVKLGYDETSRAAEKASVRTRMMQPHAGNPEGWHLPLRKGTEVMVAFIAGDPDRPVIAGAVPNAVTPSVVTSKNHTRNILHTGGDNVLEIEDLDGKQWADLRSPTKDSRLHLGTPHDDDSHQVVEHTDADCRFTIGANQDIRVGAKLTETVKGNVVEEYKTSQTSVVTGPQATMVFGAVEETYQQGHATTVTDQVTELYLSGQKTDVTGGQRWESYQSSQKTLVIGGATHTYDLQDLAVNGADSTQVYSGPKTVTVPGACKYTFDGSVTQLFGPTTYLCPTLDWTIDGSAKIVTPSWTQLFMNFGDTNATATETNVLELSVFSLSLGLISPLKSETMGVVIGSNGVKLEDTIVNAGASLVKIDLNGARFTSEKVELTVAPFCKVGC